MPLPTQPTLIDAAVNSATTALLKEAEQRFSDMLSGQKKINERQSELDTFLKRYFADKSYFDRAADWYGEKRWWEKLVIGSAVIAMTALIGAIFDLAALLTVVAVSLITAVSSALADHYTIATARKEQLCTDIRAMEETNKMEFTELSKIEDDLKKVLQNLAQAEEKMNHEIVHFKAQVVTLSEQINELETTVRDLNTSKDDLVAANEVYSKRVDELNSSLLKAQSLVRHKTSELNDITAKLGNSQAQLTECAQTFKTYIKHIKERSEHEATYGRFFTPSSSQARLAAPNNDSNETKEVANTGMGLCSEHQHLLGHVGTMLNSSNNSVEATARALATLQQRPDEEISSDSDSAANP